MFSISRANRLLAIVFDEGGLSVTEAHGEPDAMIACRHARFALPPGSTLDNLIVAAPAFTDFLKERGFESRRAIFGLPARHFLFHEFEMPRVDEQTASMALWHHASTVIAPEVGNVSLDFIGDRSASLQQKLAIVGIQAQLLQKVRVFCDDAGVEPTFITATVLALAAISEVAGNSAVIVNMQSVSAEMVIQADGVPRSLKHVNAVTAPMIHSELRRAAARLSAMATAATATLDRASMPRPLVFWKGELTAATDLGSLSEASGMVAMSPAREWIHVRAAGLQTEEIDSWIGLALIDYATRSGQPKIDLLHPRLHEPIIQTISQRWTIGAACASIALLLTLAALIDIHSLQHSADASQAKLNAIEPEVRAAKPLLQRMQYASAFQSSQPRYLTCLRDLTVAVSSTTAITLNHFDLNNAMQGSCSGEAVVQQDAVDFVDRLGATKRFGRMNCKLDSHSASGKAENVSFRIAFQYVPNG